MSKIIISNIAFNAPDKKRAGDTLSEFEARLLNFSYRKILKKKLKEYLMKNPTSSKEELELKVKAFSLSDSLSINNQFSIEALAQKTVVDSILNKFSKV